MILHGYCSDTGSLHLVHFAHNSNAKSKALRPTKNDRQLYHQQRSKLSWLVYDHDAFWQVFMCLFISNMVSSC